MATEQSNSRLTAVSLLGYLRILVYTLATLLALSLLVVGTIGLIAELKGSWHWQIHLESTISYIGLFVSRLLMVLVPLFVVLVVGRRVVPDA
ncbi:hypothetical protein BVU17_09250 [Haloarcula taiwanensis]|uniref:Uncharacterized protein n=1 Tax=Haloarcula taiwanensis TaxID=1932004 RepID=A0A2H4ZYY5_9EURY|nr:MULTISPECIES: hypothetical protein [Haloarcula]AUG47693.1 hypothetical protein BVU17_09250 [Haloarcula taiwanensis]RLM38999.1 hypothetical protein DVK01_00105 [Haloarcula sp. Atlit-120R]RLM46944.1 hypothetical protein DVK00_00105 [Haloarcula sp. Atlit-47R]RLM88782.1 hypothetical protein D3D01_20620 [Haloarcula sp. Atlit-7R]